MKNVSVNVRWINDRGRTGIAASPRHQSDLPFTRMTPVRGYPRTAGLAAIPEAEALSWTFCLPFTVTKVTRAADGPRGELPPARKPRRLPTSLRQFTIS